MTFVAQGRFWRQGSVLLWYLLLVGLVVPRFSAAAQQNQIATMLASSDQMQWVEAVQRLAAAHEVSTLLTLLRQDPRKVVRTTAALVLPNFQQLRVVEALRQALLTDPEQWVRLVAVEALGFLGGNEAREALRQARQDADPEVRQAAQEVLERLQHTKNIAFTTLQQGTSSNIQQQSRFAIRTAEEWRELWSRHASAASSPPSVDFSRHMVVAAFMGERQAGGSLQIETIEDKSGAVKVVIHETVPPPDHSFAQNIVQPFHMVTLAQQEVPIRFVYRAP